jgi:hypothetical protein
MTYVRLDDQIASHRKVLKAGGEAAWLWACAIAYCNRQLSDGAVPVEALSTLGNFRTPVKKLAATLVSVGLFEPDGDGYRVHDYLQHNPDKATVLQRMRDAADRKASYRAGKGQTPPRPNGDGHVPVGHARPSTRDANEAGASSRATRTNSPPTPLPIPTDSESESVNARPSVVPFDDLAGAMPTRRRNPSMAWEACRLGLSVPEKLHADLLSKMAVPDERALLAWYATTEREWDGKAIGDTVWQFWNKRFEEWQGSTTKARGAGGLQPLEDFIPTRFRNGGAA